MKVLIVGGGPAGLTVAEYLSKKGFETLVFEEHSEIGVPDHCAGLIGYNGFKVLNISNNSILNTVRGAYIYPPSGLSPVIVSKKGTAGVVVDRRILDKEFAERAEKSGSKILLNTRVIEVSTRKEYVKVKTSRNTFYTGDFLVIAEGYVRRITRQLVNLDFRGSLPAIQLEVSGFKDFNRDYVELFLGRKWSPGLFAWIIPLNEEVVRIGLAAENKPLVRIKYLLKKHPAIKERASSIKVRKRVGGIVLTSGPSWKFSGKLFLLVGDAAGHVKPTTGGGVVYGVLGARLAAHAISKFSPSTYPILWRRYFGRKFLYMKFVREFLNTVSDKMLENFMSSVQGEFGEIVEEAGDIDDQDYLVRNLIKNPVNILKILFSTLF